VLMVCRPHASTDQTCSGPPGALGRASQFTAPPEANGQKGSSYRVTYRQMATTKQAPYAVRISKHA